MRANKASLRATWCGALLALALGCHSAETSTGASGGTSSAPSSDGGSGSPSSIPVGSNPGGVSVSCDSTAAPGVSPMMRLSTLQYRNTVKDLLTAVGASSVLAGLEAKLGSIPDDS